MWRGCFPPRLISANPHREGRACRRGRRRAKRGAFVRKFAIIAGAVTALIIALLIVPELFRDKWEINNSQRVVARLQEAESLRKRDPRGALKIYDEVLSEAEPHKIVDETLSKALANAKGAIADINQEILKANQEILKAKADHILAKAKEVETLRKSDPRRALVICDEILNEAKGYALAGDLPRSLDEVRRIHDEILAQTPGMIPGGGGAKQGSLSAQQVNAGELVEWLVIGIAIVTVIGAFLLRDLCEHYNRLVGRAGSPRSVPQPGFGKAMLMIFMVAVPTGLWLAIGVVAKIQEPTFFILIAIAISLVVGTAVIFVMLPTTMGRAFLLAVLTGLFMYLFYLFIVLIIVLVALAVCALFQRRGGLSLPHVEQHGRLPRKRHHH